MQASIQAVGLLGIGSFIEEKKDVIYARLSEALDAATPAGDPADRFTELTLPIVNGIIHYASSPERLDDALAWLQHEWGITDEDEAMSMLAALALVFIVECGTEREPNGSGERWQRMRKYVATLAEEIAAVA